MSAAPRLRWVVPVLNPRRASLRYRCLYPMQALASQQHDAAIWRDGEPIDAGLTLVLDGWTMFTTTNSAAQAEAVLALAARAREQGARIVVDNCDNQFSNERPNADWLQGLDRLRQLARHADVIVSCSQALADAMRLHLDSAAHHVVIDDPIEEAIAYPGDSRLKAWLSPRQKLAWARLVGHRFALAADQWAGRTRLIWFGSHGNQFSPGGMLDILPLRPLLEQLTQTHPMSLTIISNQRQKFDAHFSGWGLPTHYLEWDRITFLHALRLHEISIIPSVDNAFTRCKSSNRLTLSIHHGLAVLADPIPSYLQHADIAHLGDWAANLTSLLEDPSRRRTDLLRCQQVVRSRNSLGQIAALWAQLALGPRPAQ